MFYNQLTEEQLCNLEFPLDLLESLPLPISTKRNDLEAIDYKMLFGELDDDIVDQQ